MLTTFAPLTAGRLVSNEMFPDPAFDDKLKRVAKTIVVVGIVAMMVFFI